MHQKMGIIGAGRFGRAFIEGILKAKIFKKDQIWAAEKNQTAKEMAEKFLGIEICEDFSEKISKTDILILAVKPAQISSVLEILREQNISEKTLMISVAAGTSVHKLENGLQKKNPVIRAMPNSPAMVQSGITAICRGTYATDESFKVAQSIFEALGVCVEIEEKYFDLVTALSGSGPAYFYTMISALIDAGTKGGLTKDQAKQLATHTAKGAAEMILKLNREPLDLRNDVATPGGCTVEALKILDLNSFSQSIIKAVEEATQVASRLGKN